MRVESVDGVDQISEGVIDLLRRTDVGYQVVDWKSAGARDDRKEQYEAQVARYTAMLAAQGFVVTEGRVEHLT